MCVDDKIDDVCELMKNRRLDSLCVNETKRKGSGGAIKYGSFYAYGPGVDQSPRESRGVGFMVSQRLSECVNRYECVSPRFLWLQFKMGVTQIFILVVYAPDISKSLEEREEFWADVKDILMKYNRNESLVILGDFNGWMVAQQDGYKKFGCL
ncbi:hypothetical protein EVAR_19524_1 [Eumeta japonica]|uniref:Craniofacial development protein 2 n=1 Tax=Eumeta variegata TaxID=151549 RepID=A0A4C1UGJ8_EUMVA|nr:hypothetical protein EVAR_19524_1 [Eumeta japonica]